MVKGVLLFRLNFSCLNNSFRFYTNLLLQFVTTLLEFRPMVNLSLKIPLQLLFIPREYLNCMVNLIKALLLSVYFLVVKTQLFQTFVVKTNSFIQTLFSFPMFQLSLFKFIFCLPNFLFFSLTINLCRLQFSLFISKVCFQNQKLSLLAIKFILTCTSAILFKFRLSLNVIKIALSLSGGFLELFHFIRKIFSSCLLNLQIVFGILYLVLKSAYNQAAPLEILIFVEGLLHVHFLILSKSLLELLEFSSFGYVKSLSLLEVSNLLPQFLFVKFALYGIVQQLNRNVVDKFKFVIGRLLIHF